MPDLQTEPDLNQVFNLSRATVMVVDDDPFSLKITSQALLAFGMRASHQYSSAEAASPALMDAALDLLIVDAEMPGLDGYSWSVRSGCRATIPTPLSRSSCWPAIPASRG